ncbi:hypothetical protein [Leptotrichia trevisanii]|uniref:hypothetical protein n=1 Tax=Leptotrichia trevisanii TaxID=109328 RepID=UPI0026F35D05|nr:hypothetical protein [Leptotrichia trevisanii]
MKDITDILKREILDFGSEVLQRFFKDNILESFEEIEKYLQQRVNNIQNRVYETLGTEVKQASICMTVMNEEEYRLNDGIFSPVDVEDFLEKVNENINMRNIIVNKGMVIETVYTELSEDDKAVLKNRNFEGFIEKNGEKIPVKVKIQKNEKYNKIIESLYYLFQENGIEWKTINSYYNDNFYNIVLENFEKKYIDLQDVQNLEYNLEEFEEKTKKDVFLVWNINRITVQSEDFIQPNESRIVYRYKLNYGKDKIVLAKSKNRKPFFLVYRDRTGNVNVLSDKKQDLIWEIWEIMDFSNIVYENELNFKVYSNIQKDNRLLKMNNKIRTKAEIIRFLNSYEMFNGMKVGYISTNISKSLKFLELKRLNEFIQFDFDLDNSLKQEVALKISGRGVSKTEFIKLMSFLVSELEYCYPQYIFKVVDTYAK